MERYIKLYTKILDNPKTGRLKDKTWRIMIEIFLVAGETFDNGNLPDVEMLSWRLRRSEKDVRDALNELVKIGTVTLKNDNPTVTNFEEYQNTNQTAYERVKNYRKRQRDNAVDNANDNVNDNAVDNANDNVNDMQMITVDRDIDIDKDKNKELREVKECVLKNARENKTPTPKPEKHIYGTFGNVLLTDAEAEKLRERFKDADQRIEYFSTRKKAKGYTYKSDYAAILAWADDDAEKKKAKPAQPAQPKPQTQPEDWMAIADRIMAQDAVMGGLQ